MVNTPNISTTATLCALIGTALLTSACIQSAVTGAGLAQMMTVEDALKADSASLSIYDDKFDGSRLIRVHHNLIPNPEATIFSDVYFDGACVDHKCYAVLRLGELVKLTNTFKYLHLNIDGVIIKELRGKDTIKVGKTAIEGTLVARLSDEALRAIIAAKQIDFRVEAPDTDDKGRMLRDQSTFVDGTLSQNNVLNLREMLNLAGVDPWATKVKKPEPVKTVGSPPEK